jgi:hypothetical protein
MCSSDLKDTRGEGEVWSSSCVCETESEGECEYECAIVGDEKKRYAAAHSRQETTRHDYDCTLEMMIDAAHEKLKRTR